MQPGWKDITDVGEGVEGVEKGTVGKGGVKRVETW